MLRAATETLRTLIHLKVLVAALWVVGAGPASAALTFSNSYRSPRNPERRIRAADPFAADSGITAK